MSMFIYENDRNIQAVSLPVLCTTQKQNNSGPKTALSKHPYLSLATLCGDEQAMQADGSGDNPIYPNEGIIFINFISAPAIKN